MDFRYPLASGTLKLVEGDGTTMEVAPRAGSSRGEGPPAHHTAGNVGEMELGIVLVEVK
jgi:hypothetical protein